MAVLVRANPRRVPSVVKGNLLGFDSEGWADDEFGSCCKEENDIKHPREGENCAGEECELIGGEGL